MDRYPILNLGCRVRKKTLNGELGLARSQTKQSRSRSHKIQLHCEAEKEILEVWSGMLGVSLFDDCLIRRWVKLKSRFCSFDFATGPYSHSKIIIWLWTAEREAHSWTRVRIFTFFKTPFVILIVWQGRDRHLEFTVFPPLWTIYSHGHPGAHPLDSEKHRHELFLVLAENSYYSLGLGPIEEHTTALPPQHFSYRQGGWLTSCSRLHIPSLVTSIPCWNDGLRRIAGPHSSTSSIRAPQWPSDTRIPRALARSSGLDNKQDCWSCFWAICYLGRSEDYDITERGLDRGDYSVQSWYSWLCPDLICPNWLFCKLSRTCSINCTQSD